eukprot:jgi/Psemu1/49896/gm1.49896_g
MGDDLGYPDNHIMHPGAMLCQDLIIAGFLLTQMEQSQPSANDSRFNSAYGASPTVLCYLEMRLLASHIDFRWFLITMYYLRNYPTENELERIFNFRSLPHACGKIWDMIQIIQFLKAKKITWSDDLGADDLWIMTNPGIQTFLKIGNNSHKFLA